MGVRITSDEDQVALFDSTSGIAFGPVFSDSYEAEDFLAWLRDGNGAAWMKEHGQAHFLHHGRDATDARDFTQAGIVEVVAAFTRQREETEVAG